MTLRRWKVYEVFARGTATIQLESVVASPHPFSFEVLGGNDGMTEVETLLLQYRDVLSWDRSGEVE